MRASLTVPEGLTPSLPAARWVDSLWKNKKVVILSEAKNPSVVLCLCLDRREILRFAQNDKTGLSPQRVERTGPQFIREMQSEM